jgi:hypothetical protein
MTKQSTLSAQIANITNSIRALEVLEQLRNQQPKVKRILIQFEDDSTEIYECTRQTTPTNLTLTTNEDDEEVKVQPLDIELEAHAILAPVDTKRRPGESIEAWHARIKIPAKAGKRCQIDDVVYNSIAQASKALDLHGQVIRKRCLDKKYTTWKFI